MGWDADTNLKKDWENNKLVHPFYDALFKEAELFVKKQSGGTVDGLLRLGGLDCSNCAEMLQKATGMNVYDENGWSELLVKKLHSKANWNFEYKESEVWAYWSARKFLETCANAEISIYFD